MIKNTFFGVGILSALLTSILEGEHKPLFGSVRNELIYYHSHTASKEELQEASCLCPIFEIDLAWAHSAFHPSLIAGRPYIGHPEEFYTLMEKPFPAHNVTLQEFQEFLQENPAVQVLIDIKDATVFPYLEEFVRLVGAHRCIAHAFINNWVVMPEGFLFEQHWYRENIDLFMLDSFLTRLHVPLIANCQGFHDDHIEGQKILDRMLFDAKKCNSIVALGLYYPGAILPKRELLEAIHHAGYYVWVNGNEEGFQERIGNICYIAMSDNIHVCTRFSD